MSAEPDVGAGHASTAIEPADDRTVARTSLPTAVSDVPATPEVRVDEPWWTGTAPVVAAGTGPSMPAPFEPPRVDIGARVAAYVVDAVVLLLALGVPVLILDAVFPDPDPYGYDSGGSSAAGALHSLLVLGWAFICFGAYVWTTGVSGQTVGKRLLGQKVVDVRTGDVIGVGRSVQRFVMEWLSNVVCYAGMWSAFLDGGSGRYQAWHDKACGSWVVSVPRRGIDSSLWTRTR